MGTREAAIMEQHIQWQDNGDDGVQIATKTKRFKNLDQNLSKLRSTSKDAD